GTLSHVAPELLLHGHTSRHVDTYAFGILLHELFTGRRAYIGVPKALLPHQGGDSPYMGLPYGCLMIVDSAWNLGRM
ncbi:hypothetical protein TSOC_002128, partial [Tetrabaena socialis]